MSFSLSFRDSEHIFKNSQNRDNFCYEGAISNLTTAGDRALKKLSFGSFAVEKYCLLKKLQDDLSFCNFEHIFKNNQNRDNFCQQGAISNVTTAGDRALKELSFGGFAVEKYCSLKKLQDDLSFRDSENIFKNSQNRDNFCQEGAISNLTTASDRALKELSFGGFAVKKYCSLKKLQDNVFFSLFSRF